MGEAVAEARFYHLLRVPLERALPQLLERCLASQWRAAVRLGSAERVAALDQHLWTYGERHFLPHGTVRDGDGECLWYAVAGPFKNNPKGPSMDWDTPGQFEITDTTRTLNPAAQADQRAAAVVFAPGRPLTNQARTTNGKDRKSVV